jgi:hypothetical protein
MIKLGNNNPFMRALVIMAKLNKFKLTAFESLYPTTHKTSEK